MQVTLTNSAVDGFTVKFTGTRAATHLRVVGDAAGRGVVGATIRAGYISAVVNFGAEVLLTGVSVFCSEGLYVRNLTIRRLFLFWNGKWQSSQ